MTPAVDPLGRMARIVLIFGAAASLVLMLVHGRHNTHLAITALFVVWVLAPFAALLLAQRLSRRWPIALRRTLHWVALLVTFLSLAAYTRDLIRPRHSQAAFVYVAVPPASVVAGGLVLAAAALRWKLARTQGSDAPAALDL